MTSTPTGLTMDTAMFASLIEGLARRGEGVHESGAFLLASTLPEPGGTGPAVTTIAFYDDLDAACLSGGISFSADGYTALSTICRRDKVRVVGDIHTHPGPWVGQSLTDAAHPMAALPGHIALIAPRYAQGTVQTGDLGAHVFDGTGQWTSYFRDDVTRVLHLTTPPAPTPAGSAIRRAAAKLRRLLTIRRTR